MTERNLRVLLAYDGTDFCGWQIQSDERTVQGVVEEALGRIHDRPIRVKVAGRTDSGVHARGQVISFSSDCTVPIDRFPKALNSVLPRDVRAICCNTVTDDFHARYSARLREYKYYIENASYADPFARRFVLTVKRPIDLEVLNRYASRLVGIHDFTTFSAVGDQSNSKVREVVAAAFYRERGYTVFRIRGNAFLWKMVRSIVGTIIESSESRLAVGAFNDIIASRDRKQAGTTAPAKGLFLNRVYYDE